MLLNLPLGISVASPAEATYEYVRIQVFSTDSVNESPDASASITATGASVRATPGGSDLTGTWTAAGTTGGSPANLGDSNGRTVWTDKSLMSDITDRWFQIQLDTPSVIREVTYVNNSGGDIFVPRIAAILGSNDGVNFDLIWAETELPAVSGASTSVWTRSEAKEALTLYRLRALTTYITGDFLGCAEQVWKDSLGDSIPGNAFAGIYTISDSFVASKTRDGNGSTFYTSGAKFETGGNFIGIATTSDKVPANIDYTVRADSFREDPKDYFIEKSVDFGATWTSLASGTESAWTAGETRTISIT